MADYPYRLSDLQPGGLLGLQQPPQSPNTLAGMLGATANPNMMAQGARLPPAVGGLLRQPYPSESDYFKTNPRVTGMASEDNRVVLNPHSSMTPNERRSVTMNETARLFMRQHGAPTFELTPEQQQRFGGYSQDPNDIRATIAARILSGDPSAGQPTPEQLEYVRQLSAMMGRK